jgi:hypothetical protein
VRIDFTIAPGKRHAVEWAPSLDAGPWTTIANHVPGTGALKRVHDQPPPNAANRICRARLIP